MKTLTALRFPTPSLDVSCILTACGVGKPFVNFNLPVPVRALQQFRHMVQRRLKHEPIAYLTGKKEFFGREFIVDERVLIPRPDSELLVEVALQQLPAEPALLVDVGTGSGCLAISCAVQRPDCHYLALDNSAAALTVAQINAARHACRIDFQCQDIFAPDFRLPSACALLISNPPYISSVEMLALPRSVYDYEPHIALHADDLCFYFRLAELVRQLTIQTSMCYNECRVLVEIDSQQLQAVIAVFAQQDMNLLAAYDDLAGRPRACLFSSRKEMPQ